MLKPQHLLKIIGYVGNPYLIKYFNRYYLLSLRLVTKINHLFFSYSNCILF